MGKAFNYVRGASMEQRFWSKVQKADGDACWNWMASLDTRGYGNFGIASDKKFNMQRAHRVAWELTHGAGSASDKVVCHTCDNRRCVNPGHLFLGTQRDNMQDCIAKGRLGERSGTNNPRSKLQESDIREIRASGISLVALSQQFGISKSTVHSIRARQTWRHVE